MRKAERLIAIIALAGLFTAGAAAQSPGITATPPAGRVRGTGEGALHIFKGIPYARPPVGSLRWKPPQPLPPWQGIRDATEFGAACVQPVSTTPTIYTPATPLPVNEDCLTLNIWAPANARGAPVLLWIHGGSLWTGSGRESLYDGTHLAERGIIVVTINYRLGALGYLAHPQLSAESPEGISGNYGLLDQIEALKWVQKNIGGFGGDPANVTIAGESAGGLSVLYLMTSPAARGLFAKAIAESSYMISMPSLKESRYGMVSGEQSGAALAAALHAPDIAVLRMMDAQKLNNAAALAGFGPWGIVDGQILKEQMVSAFDQGRQAHVPLLAGFNSGEARSLRVLVPPVPASAADYEKAIRDRYADLADEFLHLYPSSRMPESALATTRDALYGWTAERVVGRQAALKVPAYLYLFDHGYPAMDQADLHGFHASELPYVFGTEDRTPPLWPKIPATSREHALSDAMSDYWASFARDALPRSAHAQAWAAYGTDGTYMHFAATPELARHLMPGMYRLNEAVVCRRMAEGDQPWNWNAGLAAPKLPAKTAQCDPKSNNSD
jgi:para-nitrobenzyl esterase